MTWNFRLIQETDVDGETYIHLVEVYYKDGKPEGWCNVGFNNFDDVRQAENSVHLALTAFTKPVMKIIDGKLMEGV